MAESLLSASVLCLILNALAIYGFNFCCNHNLCAGNAHDFIASHILFLLSVHGFTVRFNNIKYKYIKQIHFCVIFLAKKFVLSKIIRIFAATESATLPI